MTIDVHAHFWTDAYLDKVTALGHCDTGAQRGRGAGDGAELDARLALMDRAGVDTQVCPPHRSSPTARTRPWRSTRPVTSMTSTPTWPPVTRAGSPRSRPCRCRTWTPR